jgi:hypothetical protein
MLIIIEGGLGKNMFYIIAGFLFALLIITLLLQDKEIEKFLWLKIILLYLCFFFSINIGTTIKIPLLIIILFIIIKRKKTLNIKLKYQALIFSLALFIIGNYCFLPNNIQQVNNIKKEFELKNRFESINSIHTYSEDSPIQDKLRRFKSSSTGVIFATWVYDYKNIPIKDSEWIWRYSYTELDVYWRTYTEIEKDKAEAYIRFNKTGEEYLGIFKKDKEGKNYLQNVIVGKFKVYSRPRSIFNVW